jgi:hypothetical protein
MRQQKIKAHASSRVPIRRLAPVAAGLGAILGAILGGIAFPSAALAYRPFDGTDAAVAELGDIEIEFQPIGAIEQGATRTLIAPANIFNYGFAKDWEAVLQGQIETQVGPFNHESLTSNEALLKHVVLPGVLQGQSGPSIATEFGVLLPSVGATSGVKPSWNWIVSQRFDWGTIHLNAAVNEFTDPRVDLFVDAIIEGPSTWAVRPVAEIFSDSLLGGSQTYSGLVGLIWQVRDELALDIAVRHAITGGHDVNELRAGLTIAFPVEQSGSPLPERQSVHNAR